MIKLKKVTFLHKKAQELDFDSLGIKNNSDNEEFTEYESYINPDSIHSLSTGYYEGTTDVHYGNQQSFVILLGTLDENMINIYG